MTPQDVDAVVCTMNSIASIERCLSSLREAKVGSIIVVDAQSADGTREVADALADIVLEDPGIGLGNARNAGIQVSKAPLILNMGSDNVLPPGQLQRMIHTLITGFHDGVGARTVVTGEDYVSRCMAAWRDARFRPGVVRVIGTPTLFRGELLRAHPFDSAAQHSDDSELCERWASQHGSTFAISDAFVYEIGKTDWREIKSRTRNYGVSDAEVFRRGRTEGWSVSRRLRSIAHPAKVDLLEPLARLPKQQALTAAPFLITFAGLRYWHWTQAAIRRRNAHVPTR